MSCNPQPKSREVTFFRSHAFFQIYCAKPYSKCMLYSTNYSKLNEIQGNPCKKVTSRDIGWAMEDSYCSNLFKLGWKMTGGTRSFTIVSLARIRGVPTRSFRRGRHCIVLTQDLSTAFSTEFFYCRYYLQLLQVTSLKGREATRVNLSLKRFGRRRRPNCVT